MEGVAFGTEVILENMRQGGYKPDSLTLAGDNPLLQLSPLMRTAPQTVPGSLALTC